MGIGRELHYALQNNPACSPVLLCLPSQAHIAAEGKAFADLQALCIYMRLDVLLLQTRSRESEASWKGFSMWQDCNGALMQLIMAERGVRC